MIALGLANGSSLREEGATDATDCTDGKMKKMAFQPSPEGAPYTSESVQHLAKKHNTRTYDK